LCLPTAPALPNRGSGDFGTSPFYGQLSDKLQLALCKLIWGAGPKAQERVEKIISEQLVYPLLRFVFNTPVQ
jgi:hypothetical protein